MKTKLFTLFFALMASVGTIFAESGTCGDNLTWDLTGGVLTISGTGEMTKWSLASNVPWYSYRSRITSVIIGNSVTSIESYAFYNCSRLTNVTVPNSVTNIGGAAFSGCSGLTSIIVENGNSVYDSRNNCNAIIRTATNTLVAGCQNTTIPNSVTNIGNNAFSDCTSLTSITIPNSVTYINYNAFIGCSGLTSIEIPNSVIRIDDYAFYECSALTSITCEAITPPYCENHVFYEVNKSIPLYVPAQSVSAYQTATGWRDFANILPIQTIHYSSITDLYNMAQDSTFTLGAFDVVYVPDFQNGSNMYIKDETGSMVIYKVGYGLQAGDHVEAGLQGKISIYNGICEIIPISQKSDLTVTAGEAPAPMEATEVPSLTNVSQFVVYKNVSFATDTAFVEGRRHAVNGTWNGQQVKFYNQYYIGATLSASKTYNITAVNAIYVTNPEAYPFAVEEVTTDTLEPCLIASGTCGDNLTWELSCDSVLTISGTGDMTDYNYESSLVPWKNYRNSIKSLIIENGVTRVDGVAFQHCKSLTYITIPNSVTKGLNFYACNEIISIDVESDNQNYSSIDGVLFDKSQTILMKYPSKNPRTEYSIPSSVTNVRNDAFHQSTNLISITIPNSVRNIGSFYPFANCTNLTSINVATDNPNYSSTDGVLFNKDKTSLIQYPGGKQGEYAIPNSVTSIGEGAFMGCAGLTSIEIPNSITSISSMVFDHCTSLSSVILPDGVTTIEYQAFYSCTYLTSVTIPSSVTSIENHVFSECSNLTLITNYAVEPQAVTQYMFMINWATNHLSNCTLYVPAQSIAAYQTADVWKEFGNILPIEGTEPTGNECSDPKILSWEPVEQQANMDLWYLFNTHDGTFNPIIPDTCDLRIKISNISDENANVFADVYVECSEPALKAESYILQPFASDSFDIDRDMLERFGWPPMIYNVTSDQNISIQAELIPDAGRDFVQDTIVAYVCEGDEYIDTIGGGWNFKIISPVEHSMTWIDTFPFRNGLQMKDSIITFYIHPLIMPEPLSAEEMRGIGAAPLLVQGMQLYVDESNAALTEYYRNLGNTVDTIAHIDTAYWAKPVYYADGSLNLTKEAPLDLSKYYSKNEYMDTLLLVVKSEECDFIMRIEYIFPIEGYKYVFRNDTICPPDPYYNPDTLTSSVLDTFGLPRMVDTITIYYSMLQPALYSQDEISLLPVVANGQPIDTTFTISALKQQFANDATDLTARVTNIKWQVLEGDVWMDMPYVVSQTATEIHMRYIVETECAIRDTSMNIILPLTPEPCLIASGTCGNNLTWTLTCDSVLTISGTGAMWDYLNPSDEPWYSYRSSITSLVIEDNVTSISWNFRGLTGLTSVVIGNSITNIESGAFEGCTGLSSLTIGNHVTSIGTAAFYQCLGLTSIEIPNSVTSIGNHAFGNCFYVTSPVYIHNNVTNIGADAFGACSIPSFEVNSDNSNYCAVDGVLFDKTKHTLIQYPGGNPRTEYTIPETVTSIEYGAFDGAELLTSITIGNNVTSIGNEAFSFCMGLTSIEIPNSVTSIERFTFSYCSNLTSVVLPNSIVDINDGAFAYCRNLTSFTNYATTPQTLKDEYVFSDVNLSNCTLYVPAQSIAAYQTADVWKEFGNILPIEEPIVDPTDSVYDVVYLDQAGLQIETEPIILHLPVAPEIEGFSFLKWQVVAGDLENGIYIQAVYTANEPTNAPEVYTNPANKAQKLIRNGKVYILTDDKVYSISGQKVK